MQQRQSIYIWAAMIALVFVSAFAIAGSPFGSDSIEAIEAPPLAPPVGTVDSSASDAVERFTAFPISTSTSLAATTTTSSTVARTSTTTTTRPVATSTTVRATSTTRPTATTVKPTVTTAKPTVTSPTTPASGTTIPAATPDTTLTSTTTPDATATSGTAAASTTTSPPAVTTTTPAVVTTTTTTTTTTTSTTTTTTTTTSTTTVVGLVDRGQLDVGVARRQGNPHYADDLAELLHDLGYDEPTILDVDAITPLAVYYADGLQAGAERLAADAGNPSLPVLPLTDLNLVGEAQYHLVIVWNGQPQP